MPADDLVEKVAFRLYNCETSSLAQGLAEIHLVVDLRREQAARSLAVLLKQKLCQDGYIVISSIDDCVDDFLDSEISRENLPSEQLAIDDI